jgi:hypothetical protein
MIVIVRRLPGTCWQGIFPNAPDEKPKAIWTGSESKLKAAFHREYPYAEIQFISLVEGWDSL